MLVFLGTLALGVRAEVELPTVNFGRLFTTPEARQLLDKNPNMDAIETRLKSNVSSLPTTTTKQQIKVSGYILDDKGHHKVWLQDNNGASNSLPTRAGMPRAKSNLVPVFSKDTTKLLKPGQIWNLNSGKVMDSYQLPAGEPHAAASENTD